MSKVDLWGELTEETVSEPEKTIEVVALEEEHDLRITIEGDNIMVHSKKKLEREPDFESLHRVFQSKESGYFAYSIPFNNINAFVLRYMLRKYTIDINVPTAKALAQKADKISKPIAKMSEKQGFIDIVAPNASYYQDIIRTLGGWRVKTAGEPMYRVRLEKGLDIETISKQIPTRLPKIRVEKKVANLTNEPIRGFDGSLESLKNVPLSALNLVSQSSQSYQNSRKSAKTIEEKMNSMKINNLYDLVLWLPRRYIDKTKPQTLGDLMIGEQATLFGTIESIGTFSGKMGGKKNLKIVLKLDDNNTINVTFWKQEWLMNKFKQGDKVVITGSVGYYRKEFNLTGSSIDEIKEASLIPIVPIYNQSTSKGITTAFILACVRELFARLGTIELEDYFKRQGSFEESMTYDQAYREIHTPTDIEKMEKALEYLAYYELVYMQLIIQQNKLDTVSRPGVVQEDSKLMQKAISLLPFTLTNSQQKAVKKMREKLSSNSPSQTLLNAEVGSGKTIVAQLSCLQSVGSGYQAALIGPTEVLAQQLYKTFERLVESLNENGENINLVYYSGNMKVREKKALLKHIESGEAHIIVGTHSLLSDTVNYHNLGFVAVDEQQKFGTEQREKLTHSRSDGLIPDLLMQTATPIPRSTAQVFYGDIDMLMLTEKPPGRKPIITKWIEENVNDFMSQSINEVWSSVIDASKRGEQTFVITPMVVDSEKIDAASVEKTYETLSKHLGLRITYVHGKMKKDEQNRVMEAFRDHQYDVLVASTVVEVGVDVSNATQVVVLSAERLGASSLHQIRGRVGRNDKQSYCFLVSPGLTANSQLRLQSLVNSDNGFDIAKADLMVRGEGKMFGSSQSGASEMIHGNLVRHAKWIPQAKQEALEILEGPYSFEALEDAKMKFNVEEE